MNKKADVFIRSLAHCIRTGANVLFVTGAGFIVKLLYIYFYADIFRLSVASGIEPYRRSKSAIWSRFVTEWGTLRQFKKDPLNWFEISPISVSESSF